MSEKFKAWEMRIASLGLGAPFGGKIEDKDIALVAVKSNPSSLSQVSDELKNDIEIVLESVKKCGDSLQYASKELKKNKQVVIAAAKQHYFSLDYADEEIKNDREIFLEELIKIDVGTLENADYELKNDKSFILEAMKQNPNSFSYASYEMQNILEKK
jgi:CRISPR/Cas system-associated protein Cas5 (RAMP superfamily)